MNQNKLAEVEEFHDKVSRLVKNELKESERELEIQLSRIEQSITEIDLKMASTLENVEEPNQIVDRVFELSISLYDAKEKNEHFQVESELREDIKIIKAQLSNEKEKIVKLIQNSINDAIRRIVDKIFGQEKKSPILKLGESNYSFQVFEDTGTGTAYTGLLEFDLAVFQLTSLPIVIHDSILFKNIENDSLSTIFNLYNNIEKQSFIAIDEIQKYGAETESLLKEKSVIQLDDDNVLYIKDWRSV